METRESHSHEEVVVAVEEAQFKPTRGDYLKFVIPSLIGIVLFVMPLVVSDAEGESTITLPVKIVSDWVASEVGDYAKLFTVLLIEISLLMTLLAKTVKPGFIMEKKFLRGLFDCNVMGLVARVLGGVFAVMIHWQWGSEAVYSDATGGVALNDLASYLIIIFFFAGMFLPLLMDFGLLDFTGTMMTKVMRPLFKLPGRSAIDCVASWVGDGTVGVLLTSKQYEKGFYTKREAAVVGTTFSFVSITFTIVVISMVGLERYFLQAYFALTAAGLAAAWLCPRIPPLSFKPDVYYKGKKNLPDSDIPEGKSVFGYGLSLATKRANEADSLSGVFTRGMQNVFDLWFGVIPMVVMLATLANIVAEYTPIFTWLGAPIVPLLHLLGLPEADAAGQMFVIGFADMLLPAVLAKDAIASDFTKFVIATVSCTQLIYMSEVGALLLSSKIPVKFWEIVVIFVERTLITLPIVVGIAYGFVKLGWLMF